MIDGMSDAEYDKLFPILDELAFFNHAGVAPICGPAADALRNFADQASKRAYVDSGWYRRVHAIKKQIATMINASVNVAGLGAMVWGTAC